MEERHKNKRKIDREKRGGERDRESKMGQK